MPSSAPAANVAFLVEAISGLQRLQREMARLSQGDENYESKKRALQTLFKNCGISAWRNERGKVLLARRSRVRLVLRRTPCRHSEPDS
jgi:hypothetical protein